MDRQLEITTERNMSIAVSVLTTSLEARNSGDAARQ
jgi:hypothetical protein